MFVKLYKIMERWSSGDKEYYLSEITVNANQITYMAENIEFTGLLREGKMNLELKENIGFTNITLSGAKQITVVGDPSYIESKIMRSNKKILRG